MATVARTTITRADAGRHVDFDEFLAADFEPALQIYELARGVIVVTEIPGINHGRIVERLIAGFVLYKVAYPGRITYQAGGAECRIRLRGMVSDRHPDQAVYLTPPPEGRRIWERWVPAIVVEVVSRGGEHRDYVEKREEYLRAGVLEYWIFDPSRRQLLVLQRAGDVWEERVLGETAAYETALLPGLIVAVGEILGPAGAEMVEEDEPNTAEPPPTP